MSKPKAKTKLKPRRIFYGQNSVALWNAINRVNKRDRDERPLGFNAWDVWQALYVLGCRCQELEGRVEHLERQQPPDPCTGE